MNTQHTTQRLILIMVVSVVMVLLCAIWLLYASSLQQQAERLTDIVQSKASLIEALARHYTDTAHSDNSSVLHHLTEAHTSFPGIGATGEFVLAQREGEHIVFLLSHRHQAAMVVPVNSELAMPMRLALSGNSGTITGYDYRGEWVLAAYEPIDSLGWGIVAKIDMEEIRAPFVQAAFYTALVAALIILLGSWLILRCSARIMLALQQSNEQQQELLDLSPIGLVLCDMSGKLLQINPAFAEIIGRTVDETLAMSYWDITPGKYAESEKAQLKLLEEHGKYGPYEKEYIHKEGYLVPVRLSGKLVQRGNAHFIWSSVEDISDQVAANRRLQQAATIFETTDEGIVITDENNRIIMVNSAFSDITGYSEIEALGQNPRLIRSGKHDEAFYHSLWQHLEQEGHWRGEMWNQRKDGRLLPVWQQISVVRDRKGKVSNYVSIFSDISELKAIEQQLAHLAHHDELTGLPNRLYFRAQVEKSLHQAKRNRHKMALLFLDLDGFKEINDSFGHDVGDQLLKVVAGRLKASVREEDTVARMGGDEFIIILNQINSHDDAALVASNIVSAVTHPIELPQHTLCPTTSVGIGIYPDDGESVMGLHKAADHAMYKAKEAGKNTYKFFAQQV